MLSRLRKHLLPIGVFVGISVILTIIFSYKLSNGEFLYITDQFFNVSLDETMFNAFYKRRLESLGVHNSYHSVIRFWDILYYLVFYSFSSNYVVAEIILIFLTLLLTLLLVYFGFLKLSKFLKLNISVYALMAVVLWYSFNSYSLVLWHGGVYNIGSALTYSIFPLLFYYLNNVLFNKLNLRNVLITCVLMFFASFTFWLFAVIVFYLALYLLILLYSLIYVKIKNKKEIILNFVKNSFVIFLAYLPLISFVIFNLVNEFNSKVGDNNEKFWPAFGNQQGGLWYQVLLIFSWGIYTVWTPRTMYSFGEYFFSIFYIGATLSLYLILGYAFLKRRKKHETSGYKRLSLTALSFPSRKVMITAVFIMLCVSAFFGKAAQPPLGSLFEFLFVNVPFFRVFRSADIRFGFAVVFSLSVLILYASSYLKEKIFVPLLLCLLFVQNFHFFTGTAIYGQNIEDKYYDRIVKFSDEHKEVIDFTNSNSDSFGYILSLPPIEYGHYNINGDHHIGQDLLPKRSKLPFVYLSSWNGTYSNTYQFIGETLITKSFENFENLPVKYVIYRKDIICEECNYVEQQDLDDNFESIFSNNTFTVYKIPEYSPLITSSATTTFEIVNPAKYRVRMENVVEPSTLNFLISYNKEWKIYPEKYRDKFCADSVVEYFGIKQCESSLKLPDIGELGLLPAESKFSNSHLELNGFANSWQIDPQEIKSLGSQYYSENADGSINVNLVIYYDKQKQYNITFLVSFFTLFGFASYILVKGKNA